MLYNGFIARQVACVDRSIYVSTWGEGVNEGMAGGAFNAWANGTFGPMVFWDLDRGVSEALCRQSEFLEDSLPSPPGVSTVYYSWQRAVSLAI